MIKIMTEYLNEKKKIIGLFFAFGCIFYIVFFLYAIPVGAVVYAFVLCAFLGFIVICRDFFKYYQKHYILNKHIELPDIYTLDMERSKKLIESDYQRLVDRLIQDINILNQKQIKRITDMTDYYTMWAHQIKTPISALNLLLQVTENKYNDNSNSDDDTQMNIRALKQELFKIDFYVDAVLQYLRLEDISSDFKFEYYDLEKIVKQSIKKFAMLFINKNIKIETGALSCKLLTDEKWLSFVIEQLLSNAVKYTKHGGTVKIYLKETFNINDRILVIEDNGIGINSEDIPRIFEKGFTGYNGRIEKKSTGIGLYLCKKAMEKMNNRISIQSTEGKGTAVYLELNRTDIIHE